MSSPFDLNSLLLNNLRVYGQKLARLIAVNSGSGDFPKIDDFKDWYDRQFEGKSIESLKPPRMVLVGLGVDNAAERMVNFLVDRGVEISLLTFQGFEHDAKTLLARHVEVDSTKPSPDPYTLFENRAKSSTIRKLLEIVTTMFMSQHSEFLQSHSSSRRHFSLDYSRHAMPEESRLKPRATLFIELDTGIDGIKVGYHPIAVHLASKEVFEDLKGHGIAFETKYASNAPHIGPISEEFKCSLRSLEEWKEREEHLVALTERVCRSYDAARESALAGE